MTDETKKLFDAPWVIEEEAPLAWYCVIDSKDSVVANDVRDQKTVKRLASLPELYDALSLVLYEECHSCLESYIDRCMIPERSSMIENGCPKKEETCFYRKYWKLLKKVKDGE